MPSRSVSRCSAALRGKASEAFAQPSLSMSPSQASPSRSPSKSVCDALATVGQLSALSGRPSASVSSTA